MWVEVPILPLPLAIFCCVINFILPGFGTMIASCSWCCCAQKVELEDPEARDHELEDTDCAKCCDLCWAGFGQLLGALGLVGWGLSCYTGVLLIDISLKYHKGNKVDAISVGHNAGSTSIIEQPGSNSGPITEQPSGSLTASNNPNVDHRLKLVTDVYTINDDNKEQKVIVVYDESVTAKLGNDSGWHPGILFVQPETDDETTSKTSVTIEK
ncbi:uncharacterized protein LOC132724556 [Ruditapes philippinarum]|uniref:uncharacterized protein LOC132724556 n=1 Tax=Ruditapes philippinarum TaxID=129788 RepID=UPI00295B112F|nr:uncharacterized protein LOC132724556 [Ruditapes philippinarum]